MPDPLISIIIPVYNRESYIDYTLSSVREQTYSQWECIIIDDGSNDGTINIVNLYSQMDNRFKLYGRNRHPKGANTCRNIGLENANGKYIMFLDSDDILVSNCLENRLKYTQEYPNYDSWTFPSVRFSTLDGREMGIFYYNTCPNNLMIGMLIRTQWPINSTLTKTEVLKKKDIKFDESLHRWQDWQFHLDFIINKLRIKRNFDINFDVKLRQENDDTSKISSKKVINDDDINSLRNLMKYTYLHINKGCPYEIQGMIVKWFGFIELIIYHGRGNKVHEVLNEIYNSKLQIPILYKLLFSFPSFLYLHRNFDKFFNFILNRINNYYKNKLINNCVENGIC